MSESVATELLPPKLYGAQRPHYFKSEGSMQWYLRGEREGLIKAGALLLHAGRYLIDPAKFDAYVIDAARKAAERQLGARNS